MIDQEKMDCSDIVDQVDAPKVTNGLLSAQISNSMTANSQDNQPKVYVDWRKTITPIESRGQAMLNAALKERNKIKLNKLPSSDMISRSLHEQKAMRLAQQVKELNNRKRSPKNNVIFTEPVVTQQYEYEPESTTPDTNGPCCSEDSPSAPVVVDQSRTQQGVAKTQSKFMKRDESEIEITKYRKRPAKMAALDSDDGDDDDDLFTLAQSDEFDNHIKKVLEHKNASNNGKRPHDSVEDSGDRMDDSPSSQHKSVSGGLFSSPKVAKIAPYFDDQLEGQRARLTGASSQEHKRGTLSNSRSRSVSHKNCNLNGNSILTKRNSLNQKSRERTTELLSYKKVSSPRVTNIDNIYHQKKSADISDTYAESPSNGYFGWLTTFLTNQMNRLIF